ncbi:prenyltransferase/squalene oxidase repeat-containing protein [Prosthecobacter sp.]|uniref:prenyltransferase/squalene oxidase repeat-containing protein n=1 Tax=Prosthecobacter sp. TaxID=1965333 RepID=UPI003783D868
MNLSCTAALLVATAFMVCRAGDAPAPTEAELRATITKSLGYLSKGNDTWMEEKNCNGCHHLPQVLWNHREARMRGFAIDEKKFEEWLQWSGEKGKDIKAGREMTAFMKLALPDKPAPELTKIIKEGQQPDGSWKAAGQFLGQRRAAPETTANSSRIFLLALAADGNDKEFSEESQAKAAALLAKDGKATSVETLAYRALFARRFGKPEEVAAIQGEILSHQHADGGWGWQIKEASSDSVATGLALFALQPSADPATLAAIARAQRWLISSQKEDGGWPVDYSKISSTDRSKPEKAKSLKDATMIYSYWGTAWSTLGLLQGLPVKEGKGSPAG